MTAFLSSNTSALRLDCHPTARGRAVANTELKRGDTIIVISALSTALLPSEKGRRCDFCHRLESTDIVFSRCTGCASYWYCGTSCQRRAWNAHHKSVCKSHARYIASPAYESMQPHERVDATLLSQVTVQLLGKPHWVTAGQRSDPSLELVMSLLPSKSPPSHLPALPYSSSSFPPDILLEIFSRFGNNNFVVHSHTFSFAHGVYPLASRLFNHSCCSNAGIKYILTEAETPKMHVVALRDISEDEEITVSYIDPALPIQDRERALDINYGFTCNCSLCTFQRSVDVSGRQTMQTSHIIENTRGPLISFIGCDLTRPLPDFLHPREFDKIPHELFPFFQSPSLLPDLSEVFSRTSHDGPFDTALDVGQTLLGFYLLIYPPNYPQTGMHALEVAKTAWNAVIVGDDVKQESGKVARLLGTARWFLEVARRVLSTLGPEGDEGGPLQEVDFLQNLIDKEST